MEGTGTRWLVTLCLLTAAQCVPSMVTSQSETDSEDSRRVLGSSVVTSVSVIMDHGNGTKTYFADGQSKNVHDKQAATDAIVGSPGNLLSPDRYEFYTFDDTGDLVKRLMTLDEIHGLIAGADAESVMADTSPTYYHDALSGHSSEALMHLPATDLESLDEPAVHRVLQSVQNVLKNEMAANSGKPAPTVPSSHRPDSASAWSALFPGLIETPDDVAQLSGYLLPSRTTAEPPPPPPRSTEKPYASAATSTAGTRATVSTTERVKSTSPKHTAAKPESTAAAGDKTSGPTTVKPWTNKKPFRPTQSFDKQKPALQKPTSTLRPTTKTPASTAAAAAADGGLDINKEMSASISDMLSQVTDGRPSDQPEPLRTNTLVENDNAADYTPEESSPELSYYSPVAMALSTAGASRPVTEALVSTKRRPPTTVSFKTTSTTQPPQKTTFSAFAATTRFGPHKSNATGPRPAGGNFAATVVSHANNGNATKPSSFHNKFNGSSSSSGTVSTTRNNYQYPPSDMSTKYAQKVAQTTQTYPNKTIEHFVKVVNKTVEKQPAAAQASRNSTDGTENGFAGSADKPFQNKVTSARPNDVNRTNVTLSNRVHEPKPTTTAPGFGTGSAATAPRPDEFVSVKVEQWPGMTTGQQQRPTVVPSTSAPYASTEKSFFSTGNGQALQNAITDANAIRDLISSLMTKPTTAATVPGVSSTISTTAAVTSTAATVPSTVASAQQTLTAAVSTTVPTTPVKTVTGVPTSSVSSATEATTTNSASSTTITASTTTTPAVTLTTLKTSAETMETTTITLTTISTAGTPTEGIPSTAATTASKTTAATSSTAVTSTTPESETQYVPVTHFLPELQVKDAPEHNFNNNNNGTPVQVDSMLKDGISAVANMLQNTQKPPAVQDGYQEMGERPYEKLTTAEGGKQWSSTEQARKQATVKSEGAAFTHDPYESTTAAAATTEQQLSRVSDPGLEMLTVFNVSSTGGPVAQQQAAKPVDLSAAETRLSYDATTPLDVDADVSTTDPAATATEVVATSTAAAGTTTSTTAASAPEAVRNATVAVASTTAAHPGPSSNAYRPPANNNASPSAVELHPAPHESMGLEASVAFLGDDVRRFVDLCNELSFKMWTAVTGKGQIASRSLVLSPFELTAMLAMVFLGARGSTSGQMNDVLRLDDMVTFNPHQVLRNITHSITNVNNPGVATASFVREIYSNKGNGKILEFYKERVQQYYDGHVEEVDFNTIGDVLRRRTNLLVKRQTLGRVVEYLRGSGLSLTPPFAAFSANVFQTSCESASTDGRDGEMYFVVRPSTRQRRLVPVPAAVWRGGFLAGYEPGLDATAVCLSPDSAVSTVLVLPGQQGQVAPGDGLARLEQRLIETSYRRGGWSRILRSLLPRPGLELQVPRFSHRSVLNTTAALQRMGLKDVFSDQKADLRGVNGLYDLYLSDMLQVNTFSTCGEDAIGARHHVETYPASPQRMGRARSPPPPPAGRRRRYADATDLPLHSPYSHLPLNLRPRQARLPDVPRLRFDRPFLYLVRHNPTGMIVYLGRFNPRLLP